MELLGTGVEMMKLQHLLAAVITADQASAPRLFHQNALDIPTATGDPFNTAFLTPVRTAPLKHKLAPIDNAYSGNTLAPPGQSWSLRDAGIAKPSLGIHPRPRASAEEPVRVVATTNLVAPQHPIEVPANATLVEWLSYSQLIPIASAIVSHGGHGTIARALGAGTPVLVCPIIGDMSETAMRVDWAGAGLSLPWRLCRPAPLRWATQRLLHEPCFTAQAEEIAAWGRTNDGAARGAELVERLALKSLAAA